MFSKNFKRKNKFTSKLCFTYNTFVVTVNNSRIKNCPAVLEHGASDTWALILQEQVAHLTRLVYFMDAVSVYST